MVRKPETKNKKPKKYQILGGIKVSSRQLSEWGKSGGRPKKWNSEAERKRATRLRKKQEQFGAKAELRSYHFEVEKLVKFKSSLEMVCSKCGAEAIGGPQHLGVSCYRFCGGKTVIKKMVKKPECQHDWVIISDFASYGYSQCKKCGKTK